MNNKPYSLDEKIDNIALAYMTATCNKDESIENFFEEFKRVHDYIGEALTSGM